jgi:hypothetical protein
MELENLLNDIHITKNNATNINLLREIFSHIISFSLVATKPKYDIAFHSKRVMEIYESTKYFIEHNNIVLDSFEDINKMPFLPCLYTNATLSYTIENFQKTYAYKYILKSNNITKTTFIRMSEYILECFNAPCCEEYYDNWTQEQINVLQYIIEYIYNNWIDYDVEIEKDTYYYDELNYDFFFNDCKISISHI